MRARTFRVTYVLPNMDLLNKIRIILVEPTHPGNIGAVARSMKTMGLSRLVMVNPKKFPHYEATKRAAGAESVLLASQVVDTLDQAIGDCTLVLGTSVRDREVSWPTLDPKYSAEKIFEHFLEHDEASRANLEVAILFGRESSGLTNAEMDRCYSQIRIPANVQYSSLNLASAVQIITYELRMRSIIAGEPGELLEQEDLTPAEQRQQIATQAQLDGHIQHLQNTLESLDFIKSKPPTLLMRKLTRLYNKAQLTIEEVQILRGILTAIQSKLTP